MKDYANTEFVVGIYPNPTANKLLISNPAIAKYELRYTIYDITGRKLKDGTFEANESKEVNVSFLPKGIYVINVSNGKKTFSNKFVKSDN